jgi:hypothetical protein
MAKSKKSKAKAEKNSKNVWPWAVVCLFAAVLVAYLPVLFGMAGPLGSFKPDVFFAVVLAPVSLVCLLCGALAIFTKPRPAMLPLIGVIVLLVLVLGQFVWVIVEVAMQA